MTVRVASMNLQQDARVIRGYVTVHDAETNRTACFLVRPAAGEPGFQVSDEGRDRVASDHGAFALEAERALRTAVFTSASTAARFEVTRITFPGFPYETSFGLDADRLLWRFIRGEIGGRTLQDLIAHTNAPTAPAAEPNAGQPERKESPA